MKPSIPILMIALPLPVTEGVDIEQALNYIGQKVSEAVYELWQAQQEADPEAVPEEEFRTSVSPETEEAFSDETKGDLLAAMGYKSAE